MWKCLGEVPQLAWRGGSQRSDGEGGHEEVFG